MNQNQIVRNLEPSTDDFIIYLDAARAEALPERESAMFRLRYGMSGQGIRTLAEIGQIYGISRERVRQLLLRSNRRILTRAKRKLKAGTSDSACLELLKYVRDIIRPNEANADERLASLIEEELSFLHLSNQAIELVVKLAYQTSDVVSVHLAAARNIIDGRRLEQRRQLTEAVRVEKTRRLLARAWWPRTVRKMTSEDIIQLRRHREVSLVKDGKPACFFSDKLNRDIEYESELERYFLERLELDERVIAYQEQPIEVFYDVEGTKTRYYPDVIVIFKDYAENYRGIVVEIKPVFHMALEQNLLKWEALKSFCEKYGLGLLITDGRYTIEEIRKHKSNSEYANDVLSAVKAGPVSWAGYRLIRDRHGADRNDFVATILKNNLRWRLGPFRLSLT